MSEIITALTQIFNVAIFGSLNPSNNAINVNLISIGNFTLNINFLSNIFAIIIITITTILTIYYLFDVIIILWKRYTK